MLDLPSPQTPTPQHHKTTNPQNATKARTPREPPNNKTPALPNTCMSYSAATAHQHQHQQTHITSAANLQRFKCMSDFAPSYGIASTEDASIGQVGTSSKQSVNIKAILRIVGFTKTEQVASPSQIGAHNFNGTPVLLAPRSARAPEDEELNASDAYYNSDTQTVIMSSVWIYKLSLRNLTRETRNIK